MTTIAIEGITDLGQIYDEDVRLDNKLTTIKRPFGSSENTTVVNIGGKQRTIIIQGICIGRSYAGATPEAQMAAFIAQVEGWVNQNLTTGVTLTNSFGVQYEVLPAMWRWRKSPPGNRILYTLTLIEGGALSAFSP